MVAPVGQAVTEAVEKLFVDDEDRAEVLEVLALYGDEAHEREPDRVRLAILKLSGADKAEVWRLVDNAKQDYRDILWWAGDE